MFNFTDFLAFMAIEDAMEEEKNPSPKYSSGSSDEKMTTGCKVAVAGTIIGIVLGIVIESWLCFILITAAGFIIGLCYDLNRELGENKEKGNIKKES